MKRIVVLIMLAIVAFGAIYADDDEEKPAFAVSVGPFLTAGITNVIAGGQAQFLWKPGFFGVSAGLRAAANLGPYDVYLIPNVGVRLGWFVLEGGGGFKVVDAPPTDGMNEIAVDTPIVPFVRAGLSIPIGSISIDFGGSVLPTDLYLSEIEADNFGQFIGAIFGEAMIAGISFVKLDVGINYVIRF